MRHNNKPATGSLNDGDTRDDTATLRRSPALLQRGPWYLGAELGCLGLGVALALSTVRLFSDVGAVRTLTLVAMAAWALAVVIRRSALPGWAGDVLHLVLGLLVLLVVAAPAQRWGFLPSPGSVTHIVEVLRDDFQRFDQDIAPMVPRLGHMVALGGLIWVLALFASTAAMRFHSPVQAAIPHTVAIIGMGFLGRSSWRLGSAAILLVAVAVYTLTQTAWRDASGRWVPASRSVPRARLATGSGLALAGMVTALVVSPLLPVEVDPVLDVRRGGLGDSGPRTVVSPFVEVGSDLQQRSNELLFTMEAQEPQYWRLTALDTYDEENAIWVLSNSYEPVSGRLSPVAAQPGSTTLDVRTLGGIWIPSPPDPVTADSDFELNWDPASESLIKRSGDLDTGDAVEFATSAVDLPDPASLAVASPARRNGELSDTSGAPEQLIESASAFSRASRTPHDSLLALQNHFRSTFDYDESVDFSDSEDPLQEFLDARAGFCQQFSTAFALGARAMGFPTRVVVGFTPGDSEPPEEPGGPRTFAVRGRHAHAWPEVLYQGIGWVPYEPTPGRGNPAASELTGVPAAQAAPPEGTTGLENIAPEATTSEAPATTTTALQPPGNAQDPSEVSAGGTGETDEPDRRSWIWVPLLAFAVVAVGAVGALAWGASRRGDQPSRRSDPVQRAWLEVTRRLDAHGMTATVAETPLEFAARCNEVLELPELVELAVLESARRWSGRQTSNVEAVSARAAAAALRGRLAQPDQTHDEPEVPVGV